jgi:hypothetical protein
MKKKKMLKAVERERKRTTRKLRVKKVARIRRRARKMTKLLPRNLKNQGSLQLNKQVQGNRERQLAITVQELVVEI